MIIPFKNSFDNAKTYDKYANNVLYISTIIIIIAFILQVANENWKYISEILNSINCFFIVAFAVLEFITKSIFAEASSQKRYDYIDNSFETSFSEENSENYYSNDNIEKGIYKMAVNGFENSYFTYNIAKKMIKSLWIKNTLIAIIFIFLAIMGFNSAFVMILQLSLWRDNHALLVETIKQSPILWEIESMSEDLKELSELGLEAARALSKHKRLKAKHLSGSQKLFEKASKPRGQVELMVVPAIRKLVEAAGK